MVEFKSGSYSSTFQQWFPLKLVPVADIPSALDYNLLESSSVYDLAHLAAMMQNLCQIKNGVGLSALQVGIPIPLFVVLGKDADLSVFIDCQYESDGNKIKAIEGCLSIIDEKGVPKRFLVERYEKIKVKGKKLVFKDSISIEIFEIESDGFLALVLQHEIDHHNFKLISEIGEEIKII